MRRLGIDQRRIDVNPVLGMAAARKIEKLPAPARELLAELLVELGADAKLRAERSWRQNKGPIAAYWKAVGVYARHIARAVKP